MTILTNEEMQALYDTWPTKGWLHEYRKVESAVLAKLREQQEPTAAYFTECGQTVFANWNKQYKAKGYGHWKPLFEHHAPEGWQPIETAPKSRSAVLVYCQDNLCVFCVSYDRLSGEWTYFGGGGTLFYSPTHWMPLPQPPMAAARSE